MKRLIIPILALVFISACPGATHQAGMVRVGAIAPTVRALVERHDAYVTADPALEDPATNDMLRRNYLRESEILLGILTEAETAAAPR